MEKLKLDLLEFKEILTREQLQRIVGGDNGSDGSSSNCEVSCTDDGSWSDIDSCELSDVLNACGSTDERTRCFCTT
ncbi:hypothetical protein RYH73_13100 [Olivibacter sp. CPCC 100613]|uniref:hypothetical protein n=1 Tax=Olivibacter sp. CPCC 100613 TaxID=3079931 RepID=UPI002FFA7C6E